MSGLRIVAWVLCFSYLGFYLFLVLIGAWSITQIVPTALFAGALGLLGWHTYAIRREQAAHFHDPHLNHERERRGF